MSNRAKERAVGLHQMTVDAMKGMVEEKITTGDFSLEVVEGPHAGLSLRLDTEMFRIGRGDWCDLCLPDDPWISTVHCEGLLDEKGLRISDLDSRNGLMLNDMPVLRFYLVPGARLQVGQSVLILRSHEQTRELSRSFHDSTRMLVGKSMAMRKIFSFLPKLAARKVTTLLTGETGTGKTSIAHAIHAQHSEHETPFIVVNCAALPPALIESFLFGHEKGSFTGANKQSKGFFEQANGGTLFLDEIAELPLEMQPKFLDVLERKKIRRLGSEVERDVDFHLITATHKDLEEECKAGRFREDLYFRLSVMRLNVPALRDRKEDLPLLIEAFLQELNPEHQVYLTSGATQVLKSHIWPGNIRELRNTLERSLIFLEGNTLDAEDIELDRKSESIVSSAAKESDAATAPVASVSSLFDENRQWVEEAFPQLPLSSHEPPLSLKDILKHAERFYIAQALDESGHNAPKAAKLLSLSESWLYSRIKLYRMKTKRKRKSDE